MAEGLAPVEGMAAALADAEAAIFEYEHARGWLRSVAAAFVDPLAVEVWVLDLAHHQVLLVRHGWRGWVPPGGAAGPGEPPRVAAARELLEETGIAAQLLPEPAAVTVRSYHPDWPVTLGLSYVAIVDRATPVVAEPGQPVAWKALAQAWESSFPDDRDRIGAYVAWAARKP